MLQIDETGYLTEFQYETEKRPSIGDAGSKAELALDALLPEQRRWE
jgi:hypothetical protein